jgi:hypothetical protein
MVLTTCKWWLKMDFFLHFQRMHPSIVIGKKMFDSLWPYWVKKMKDRNVCCHIYHVEMEELRIGFNTWGKSLDYIQIFIIIAQINVDLLMAFLQVVWVTIPFILALL